MYYIYNCYNIWLVKLIENCNRRVLEVCEGLCFCKYEFEKLDKFEKLEKLEKLEKFEKLERFEKFDRLEYLEKFDRLDYLDCLRCKYGRCKLYKLGGYRLKGYGYVDY